MKIHETPGEQARRMAGDVELLIAEVKSGHVPCLLARVAVGMYRSFAEFLDLAGKPADEEEIQGLFDVVERADRFIRTR